MNWRWLIVVAACGHAPPAKPAAVERPVSSIADLAGHWVSDNELDWGFRLAIDADGTIDQWIDRGRMGRCEQKGKAQQQTAGTFVIAYIRDECAKLPQIQMKVASFTGDVLTIELVGDGVDERHVYRRAPQ